MLIIILSAIIVTIIACFLIINSLSGGNKENNSIIFVEDSQLVYYDYERNKKIIIEEEYDLEKTSYLIADSSNSSNNYLAYVYDEILYLFNTKNGIKEIIATKDIKAVQFSLNDKFLLYQDIDTNIYSYNLMNKEITKIISGNLNPEIIIRKNKLLIQANDSVYLKDMNTNEEKQKIISAILIKFL